MKTITIKIPGFLNDTLDAVAASRKQTKSAIVRDLLMEALPAKPSPGKGKTSKPSLHDRLSRFQTAGGSGMTDLASNARHLEGYGRE